MIRLETPAGERFGTVLRERKAGEFTFRESHYDALRRMPMLGHPDHYFCIVVEGGMRERVSTAERLYEAGSIHYHPCWDPHAARVGSEGLTSLSIVVRGPLTRCLDDAPRAASRTLPLPSSLASRCYGEFHASDTASDLALEALVLEMSAALLRDTPGVPHAPVWLRVVRDYLHAHCAERIALADLSRVAGVHRVHLVRAFHRHMGRTPGAYVREMRIERARTALSRTDRSIASIALDAGFASQAHFTRVFSRSVGLPPGAYRRARTARAI